MGQGAPEAGKHVKVILPRQDTNPNEYQGPLLVLRVNKPLIQFINCG